MKGVKVDGRWITRGAAGLAAFTVLHALTYLAGWRLLDQPGTVGRALWAGGVHALAYLLGGAGLVWVARTLPLTRERWPLVVAGNLLAVLAGVVLYTGLRLATWDLTTGGAPMDPWLVFLAAARGMFLVYALLLSAAHAAVYFARDRDVEVRRNRLRAELSNARLEATQLQLQPHLLFSAFRTLAGLMRTDVAAADRLLLQLAALLRATLRRVDAPLVALREDAEALEVFLEVARVTGTPAPPVALALPEALDAALVPAQVLQRLVTLAGELRGEAPHADPVRISASWSAAYLWLVASTPAGGGRDRPAEGEELELLRGALAEIYGDEMALDLVHRGARAELRVKLPLLTQPPNAAGAPPPAAARAARASGA